MPNRMLKETIRTSRNVNSLTDFEFRLWVYLITYVDDYGRGSADPELLRGLVFPRRSETSEKKILDALSVLASKGMIVLYKADGEPFFYFPKWKDHQRIQTKKSKYPAPDDSTVSHGESPWVTVDNGDPPPETKPIRNQIETKEETKPVRAYGEYGWVKLTDEQFSRLMSELGELETKRCIRVVDESAQSTGNKNKWKDWNLVVRRCNREGWGRRNTNGRDTANASPENHRESTGGQRYEIHYDNE